VEVDCNPDQLSWFVMYLSYNWNTRPLWSTSIPFGMIYDHYHLIPCPTCVELCSCNVIDPGFTQSKELSHKGPKSLCSVSFQSTSYYLKLTSHLIFLIVLMMHTLSCDIISIWYEMKPYTIRVLPNCLSYPMTSYSWLHRMKPSAQLWSQIRSQSRQRPLFSSYNVMNNLSNSTSRSNGYGDNLQSKKSSSYSTYSSWSDKRCYRKQYSDNDPNKGLSSAVYNYIQWKSSSGKLPTVMNLEKEGT
jgi:hypothetical protein